MTQEVQQTPVIGISLSVDVAKGRNLVFQTHIERDASVAWINVLLDRLNAAADRQQAAYELEYYEFQIRNDTSQLNDIMTKMALIDEREKEKAAEQAQHDRRPWRRSAPEQTHYDGLVETCKRLEMTIKTSKERLADLKQKVGERVAA